MMNIETGQDQVAADQGGLRYLAIRSFIRYGVYALIPLFIALTRSPAIALTPDTWSVPILCAALLIFVLSLALTLRHNSLLRTNVLLGFWTKSSKPRRDQGRKLLAQCAGLYCLFGAMVGCSYVMTGDLLLRYLPAPSPARIAATLLSTHRGTGSRSDPCLTKNVFQTKYGEVGVCLNSIKKSVAMPDHLSAGESLLLEGHANERIFVLDAVIRENAPPHRPAAAE